jgi:hypothetical protein
MTEVSTKYKAEVIAFTPLGKVLTFNNLLKARAVLLKQFHHYIVADAQELGERYSKLQLLEIYKVCLKHQARDLKAEAWAGPTGTKERMAMEMWPMLVAAGRTSNDSVYGTAGSKPKSSVENIIMVMYKPGEDSIADELYRSLARQARVIVDLCVEHIPEAGIPETTFYKLIMDNAERLKTRQGPWRIYKYYEHKLISRRMIKILK